ncbi:MAG: hypothetical protein GY790_16735 [Bacteroidetes bacterium]|nr:hypothetical protein [Bacteroidota bacterium]
MKIVQEKRKSQRTRGKKQKVSRERMIVQSRVEVMSNPITDQEVNGIQANSQERRELDVG